MGEEEVTDEEIEKVYVGLDMSRIDMSAEDRLTMDLTEARAIIAALTVQNGGRLSVPSRLMYECYNDAGQGKWTFETWVDATTDDLHFATHERPTVRVAGIATEDVLAGDTTVILVTDLEALANSIPGSVAR